MADSRTAAAQFRSRHGLGSAPLRDVAQALEDFHNAWVMQMPLPEGVEARTIHSTARGFTVVCVGTTDNPERQRFTLAHELGHLEAGTLSTVVHAGDAPTRDPAEQWADEFARNVLAPVEGLRDFLRGQAPSKPDPERTLSEVVRFFGVSPPVALIQLRKANLLSFADASNLQGAVPRWTSSRLAIRFGWQSERDPVVRAALSARAPVAVVEAATSGYLAGHTSLETLAGVAGVKDVESYERVLAANGIAPPAPEDVGEGAGWQEEDFSDLFGDDA